jgi:hypothetical protein
MSVTLNGWQRLWVVVVALWAVAVIAVGYASMPEYLWHPDNRMLPEVVRQMSTKTWQGEDCIGQSPEIGARRNKNGITLDWDGTAWREVTKAQIAYELRQGFPVEYGGLSDPQVIEKMERTFATFVKDVSPTAFHTEVKVPIDGLNAPVILCFGEGVSRSEMERIAADYRDAYSAVLKTRRMKSGGWMFAFWLVPGAFAYAFGSALAWIRKGFKSS